MGRILSKIYKIILAILSKQKTPKRSNFVVGIINTKRFKNQRYVESFLLNSNNRLIYYNGIIENWNGPKGSVCV